ncbi:hypothetical protein AALP_AA7G163400 [Arabis alpina]|uniref:Uncharacterized protein n=1 Tax=Arabis alpina TaxID=50452 RepID=A0A087GIG8_ARAAL|nr:hypothetical protein AALP_AA7G163400 [Arabis alpina]
MSKASTTISFVIVLILISFSAFSCEALTQFFHPETHGNIFDDTVEANVNRMEVGANRDFERLLPYLRRTRKLLS